MKKLKLFSLLSAASMVMGLTIFLSSCQKDDIPDDSINLKIANSPELEDYIIAASDLRQSLAIFESELTKVDFTKLETTIIDGKKVEYMPASIRSLNIEQKTINMLEKKKVLFEKHPEFASFSFDIVASYIDHCFGKSIKVSDFFLEKGIDIHQPQTKFQPNEVYYYNDMNQLVGQLYNWTMTSGFVEVGVVFYANGTAAVCRESANTNEYFEIRMIRSENKFYYPYVSPTTEVRGLAHTHTYYNYPTYPDDYNLKNTYPGVDCSIYYNGAFYHY